MRDAARPDPLAAAHRVKDRAVDLALDLADGYRRSSRFFKLRAAVAASWAILSLATVWLACPTGGAGNALDAKVELVPDSIMGAEVLVQNDSTHLWTDVVLTLDGGWRAERKTVRAGDKLVLSVSEFARDGASAPRELRPRTLAIDCEQGHVLAPLGGKDR